MQFQGHQGVDENTHKLIKPFSLDFVGNNIKYYGQGALAEHRKVSDCLHGCPHRNPPKH